MTLKELGSCDHVRRGDRVVEFKKNEQSYHAICPKCGGYMRWDNWTKLHEPLRAKCTNCGVLLPSTELNLQPVDDSLRDRRLTRRENGKEINNEPQIRNTPNPL